ncbi:MAG: type II secretion system minor pseudopilin GspK [Syntrophaceae bacterium]
MKNSEKGIAIVLVLLIMALMTAMVVEFASMTYTANASLSNWKDSQTLSLAARSGINLAVKVLSDKYDRYSYTYPGSITMPIPNILENFEGIVVIKAEDENGKFNINSIVMPNNTVNKKEYDSFKRLLKNLELDEKIADKVADWIDNDNEPRLEKSEEGAKNAYMDSVSELCLIIDSKSYEKLLPFITVYGIGNIYANTININSASVPVLMAFDDAITAELAERIVSYRAVEPFQQTSDIVKVAGFEGSLGQSLMGRITVKASNFRIVSEASVNGIKRIIDSVVGMTYGSFTVMYWQET